MLPHLCFALWIRADCPSIELGLEYFQTSISLLMGNIGTIIDFGAEIAVSGALSINVLAVIFQWLLAVRC